MNFNGQNKNLLFKPVKTTQDKLGTDLCPIQNGYLYFTTDTKKIHLGIENGNSLVMGGSTNIYYGKREVSAEESNEEHVVLEFDADFDIEGSQIPNKNDLILNVPDGGFYRVLDVINKIIVAEQITISGSGGGGGSIGPGGVSNRPSIVGIDWKKTYYFRNTQPDQMKIYYKCSSPIKDTTNYISSVTYTIGSTTYTEELNEYFNEETGLTNDIEFDISKYLKDIKEEEVTSILIVVTDYFNNKSTNTRLNIYITNLTLITKSPILQRLDYTEENNIYSYICVPSGGSTSGFSNRIIEWKLADEDGIVKISGEKNIDIVGSNTRIDIDYSLLNHGVYYFSAIYKVKIIGTSEQISSEMQSTVLGVYRPEEGKKTEPLILTNFISQQYSQYTPYTLQYLIVDSDSNDKSEILVNFQLNNDSDYVGNEVTQLNTLSKWIYSFLTTGNFDINLIYKDKTYPLGKLNIIKYTGNAPTLSFDDIDYCLSAAGRSNTEFDRDIWNSVGKNKTTPIFENFLWGDNSGWIKDKDENNEVALKISNKAKLIIKGTDFAVLKDQTDRTSGQTSGLLIEMDIKFKNISDYTKPLIKCISETPQGTINAGFELTGQKAMLNTTNIKPSITNIDGDADENDNVSAEDASLQALIQYYDENQRIHLAYHIPAYLGGAENEEDNYYFLTTYLNGVLSGISRLTYSPNGTKEMIRDWDSSNPADVVFDSTYGDIYLYNFRVTRNESNPQEIIRRYIADYETMGTRISLWEQNNLFGVASNKIDLGKVKQVLKDLDVPYILMRGGIKMDKDTKKSFVYDYTSPGYRLPRTKSDYRLMSMEMYYKNSETPIYSVPVQMEDINNSEKKYNSFVDLENNKIAGSIQATRGVQVYGQGTSSMNYPIKNLRLKFLQKQDYPVVYDGLKTGPEIITSKNDKVTPVKIVCLKADYMDSSSTHNTQAANFIYDLYTEMQMKTPPQNSSLYENDLVTAIRGYPVICFFSEDNTESGYTYIGRYNFNLDKATPEPFGFLPKFNENEILGYEVDDNGEIVYRDDQGNQVSQNEGKPHDIIQCWEVLNNNTTSPVQFLTEAGYETADGHKDFKTNMKEKWSSYFEDRYPDRISKHAEDNELTSLDQLDLNEGLFRMAFWVNSTATINNEITNKEFEEPIYYITRDKIPQPSKDYYNKQYEKVNIETIDNIKISTNSKTINNLKVSLDAFKNQIKIDNNNIEKIYYDVYGFTYSDEKWWNGLTIIDDLSIYGIGYTGMPSDGDAIYVDYFYTYSDEWKNGLYEKFTNDTKEYRLTKFYNEFEDYFDKQYSLFYYILTLVLLMIDSRAKNMMLATWDQKIWYPIFYDMDTMLGINNTGFNKFLYNIEDTIEGVYNSYESVLWNNFREVFQQDIIDFYNQMRKKGLSSEDILDKFNTHGADSWTESMITADAIYKYQNPYTQGFYGVDESGKEKFVLPGTKNYLYASQGRRSNHRRWWLTSRLNYFDSKYISYSLGDEKPGDNTFSFRAYSFPEQSSSQRVKDCIDQTPPSHKFRIKSLVDAYHAIMVGNNIYRTQDLTRTENETVYLNNGLVFANQEVDLGPENAKHEVESWILNPDLISDLGDLSDKYIGSWGFPDTPTKLTELKFGRTKRSHPNAYSNYYNSLLTQLDIGSSCPLLQYINVGGYKSLPELNLSKCLNLIKLDASNCSNLGALTLPSNSIIQELYLPDNLQQLFILGQPYLKTIEFDTKNGSHLTHLSLDNISMNTYQLCSNFFSSVGGRFKMTNINWTIDNINELSRDDNGKIVGINILDTILNSGKFTTIDDIALKNALTGKLTIDVQQAQVDEYALYSKYIKDFPQLEIIFGDNVSVDKALELIFFSDKPDEENRHVIYNIKIPKNNNKTLEELVYNNPVTGQPLNKNITKDSTEKYSYNFSGFWIDEDDENQKFYYVIQSKDDIQDFRYIPQKSITFYPDFEENLKKYPVTFYDNNNNKISQGTTAEGLQIYDAYITWGEKYNGYFSKINYYPMLSYNDTLQEHERYAFKGWTYSNYNNSNKSLEEIEFVDPSNLTITKVTSLYAYYVIEDARYVASNDWYFDQSNGFISIKNEYKNVLQENITIPKTITTVGDFRGLTKVKAIYFQSGSICERIQKNAFDATEGYTSLNFSSYDGILENIYLPDTVKYIDEHAFAGLLKLTNIDIRKEGRLPGNIISIGEYAFAWTQAKISSFGESLVSIGSRAFMHDNNLILLDQKLPDTLTALGNQAFYDCNYLYITTFGDKTYNNVLNISGNPFNYAGHNYQNSTVDFNFYNEINTSAKIFSNYLSFGQKDIEVIATWYVSYGNVDGDNAAAAQRLVDKFAGWLPVNQTYKITVEGADGTRYEKNTIT